MLMVNMTRRADEFGSVAGLARKGWWSRNGTVSVMRVARPVFDEGGNIVAYEFKDLVGATTDVAVKVRAALRVSDKGEAMEELVDIGRRRFTFNPHAECSLMVKASSRRFANQGWVPLAGGVSPNLICDGIGGCAPAIAQLSGQVAGGWAYWFPPIFSY
jgi:hypothetical protein